MPVTPFVSSTEDVLRTSRCGMIVSVGSFVGSVSVSASESAAASPSPSESSDTSKVVVS